MVFTPADNQALIDEVLYDSVLTANISGITSLDVNDKSILDIARELTSISKKAQDKKLKPADMEGGCFTISSLGGIGGTYFTPIINPPEVAILGISRFSKEPVIIDGQLKEKLMLPFSLSYDHRVIDGADAARFTSKFGRQLSKHDKLT